MTDHALLVGINAYEYPNQLRGCVNDVLDMRDALIGRFGFPNQVGTFTTPAELESGLERPAAIRIVQDAAATAQGIKAALKATVASLAPGDRFLFHYSGHGAQLEDGNAATDVICPVDFAFTAGTAVTVADFHDIFSKIPAGVTATWVSDSCHSGDLEKDYYHSGVPRLFRARNASELARGAALRKAPAQRLISEKLPHVALISGCKSSQTSADASFNDRYNGALSYFLLHTLNTAAGASAPLPVLVSRVRAALNAAHYHQIPQLSGPPSEVNLSFLQLAMTATTREEQAALPSSDIDAQGIARELMATAQGHHKVPADVPADWVARMSAALGGELSEQAIATALTTPPATLVGETGRELVREGAKVHVSWWGFRIALSHEDIKTFASKEATTLSTALLEAVGAIAGPAAPFLALAGAFLALELYWVRATDETHGATGANLVMAWLAPGVFVVLPS